MENNILAKFLEVSPCIPLYTNTVMNTLCYRNPVFSNSARNSPTTILLFSGDISPPYRELWLVFMTIELVLLGLLLASSLTLYPPRKAERSRVLCGSGHTESPESMLALI